MKNVKDEHRFYFKSGRIAKNLAELKEGLETMDQEEFDHHVTAEKNDFASWVEHAVEDKVLADKLRIEKKRENMITQVNDRIRALTAEVGQPQGNTTPLLRDATILKDFVIGVVVGLIIGFLVGRFLI